MSVTELLVVVAALKSKKSENFNGLSMFFIKNIINLITGPLKIHVFNLSFSVPLQLKTAKIIPVFKSGDPHCLDNYRPISL